MIINFLPPGLSPEVQNPPTLWPFIPSAGKTLGQIPSQCGSCHLVSDSSRRPPPAEHSHSGWPASWNQHWKFRSRRPWCPAPLVLFSSERRGVIPPPSGCQGAAPISQMCPSQHPWSLSCLLVATSVSSSSELSPELQLHHFSIN